jgi:hypothetical protein
VEIDDENRSSPPSTSLSTAVTPREELTFQVSLSDYGHTLRQEGGSVTDAWKPGAPPAGWIY